MRYIVSKTILNHNVRLAQEMVGKRKLSLIFKEYCEHLNKALEAPPSGEVFSVNIENTVCYALGLAGKHNKGALVNNMRQASELIASGVRLIYIPIDTGDSREGLSVCEARALAENIHGGISAAVTLRGMVTNGCINDEHFGVRESWDDMWSPLSEHLESLSVGGSFWLDKADELPEYVSDVRIGRFMLFGRIPFSDKRPGEPCLKVEAKVLGVNLTEKKLLLDIGDAYCEPSQLVSLGSGLELCDVSSNYAVFHAPRASQYYVGQKMYFAADYKHSSALAKLPVEYVYE